MEMLGFVVEALSNLKVLGRMIDTSVMYGFEPVLFIPRFRKGKPYDTVTARHMVETFAHVSHQNIHIYDQGMLSAIVCNADVHTVCLLNPYRNFAHDVVELAKYNVQVYGFDYFVNSIYVCASYDDQQTIESSLRSLQKRIVASAYWKNVELAIQPRHKPLGNKFVSLGSPLIDVCSQIDPTYARSRLSLDAKKKIISVFTPNIRDHHAYYFYGIRTAHYLAKVARSIRDYCDASNFSMVVKLREKQWDAKPFATLADRCVMDLNGQCHPSTSALLISCSACTIHFGSMVVLEAAASRVPSIGISPERVAKLHTYMRKKPRDTIKRTLLSLRDGSLFNFRHVSSNVPITISEENLAVKLDRMIDSEDDTTQKYNAFNKKFSGWDEKKSATERFYSYIRCHTSPKSPA